MQSQAHISVNKQIQFHLQPIKFADKHFRRLRRVFFSVILIAYDYMYQMEKT